MIHLSQMAVLIFFAAFIGAPSAFAGTENKPLWASQPNGVENYSYFATTEGNSSSSNTGNKFFDPKVARQLQLEYQDMMRDYEMRQKYDLLDQELEKLHAERMKGFGRHVLHTAKNFQIKQGGQSVKKAVEQDKHLKHVMKPAAVAAAVGAACMGEPVELEFSDETHFRSRTDLRSARGEILLSNPVLNTEVNVVAGAPASRDPMSPPTDPVQREERYRVNVFRNLPNTDVTTGMSYGSTTTTVTAQITKPCFADNLTCYLRSQRPMDPSRSEVKSSEQLVGVNYQIRF